MVYFDNLGFATNYDVEVDLEYPGMGQWDAPIFGHADEPTIARITPNGADPWLLSWGLPDAIFGTPDPDWCCVFARYNEVTLFDVRHPANRVELLELGPPLQVKSVVDLGLLLVSTETDVTAIGPGGKTVWESGQLFSGDLRIRRTDNGRIVCRGWNYWQKLQTEVTLDASTGQLLTGDRYPA